MAFVDESLARGISRRIIRELFDSLSPENNKNKDLDLMSMAPKKRAQTIIKLCRSRSNGFVFLEDRYRDKSRWEILWGEWNLGYSGRGIPSTTKEYDRLVFDLMFNRKGSFHLKFFYIIISKHALVRMIMRSGRNLLTRSELFEFLGEITKDGILAAMSMNDGNPGDILFSNGLYLPLVSQEGINIAGRGATSIVIKTALPKHFAVEDNMVLDRSKFRSTIFEFPDSYLAGKGSPPS